MFDAWDNVNRIAFVSGTNLLICPADQHAQLGITNYGGNLGDHRSAFGSNGVFGSRPVSFAELRDGASSTVAISEYLIGICDEVARLRSNYSPDRSFHEAFGDREFVQRCKGLIDMHPSIREQKGSNWMFGVRNKTWYAHAITCNQPSFNNVPGSSEVVTATTATSLHPGGVNCLFVDGHVSYQLDQTNLNIWRAIGTRHGREVLPESP